MNLLLRVALVVVIITYLIPGVEIGGEFDENRLRKLDTGRRGSVLVRGNVPPLQGQKVTKLAQRFGKQKIWTASITER